MCSSGTGHVSRRGWAEWLLVWLAVAVVFALGFVVGAAGPWRIPGWPWTPKAEEGERKTAEGMLSALEAEGVRLERREAELQQAMREAAVPVVLLRARGQGEGPPWREQEEARQSAELELARVRRQRQEVADLAEELREAVAEGGPVGAELAVQRRARAWLTRWALLREGAGTQGRP